MTAAELGQGFYVASLVVAGLLAVAVIWAAVRGSL